MAADDVLWEAVTANGYRVRVEPNGASKTLRFTVSRVEPEPKGRGRRRTQPVLDVRQADELGRVLVSWAEANHMTDAEYLADQLRRQSFDPRDATLTDQALRAQGDREGRPPWADHWQT